MMMNLDLRAKQWCLPVLEMSGVQANALPVPAKLSFAHPVFGAMTLCPASRSDFPAMVEEIFFTLGGELIILRCQRSVAGAMVQRAGHAADKPALHTDAPLAALVLEHLLTPALEALEATFSTSIQLLSVRRAESDLAVKGIVTRLQITADLWPAMVCVELQASATSGDTVLRRMFERLLGPPPEPPFHLTTQVSLLSPGFKLTLSEVQALTPGDALMLDDRWLPTNEANIGVAGHFAAPATWRGNRLHLTGALKRSNAKDMDPMMTSETEPDRVFDLDDLPVTLTLELDRIELPFFAIADLNAGSVLPFGTPLPQTVRVLINGRLFATAGLVQIDGRLGIRIADLQGKLV
jgi:type III secretion system YscQ/HrcQ family protein